MSRRRNNWACRIIVVCLMLGIAFIAHAQNSKTPAQPQPAKPGPQEVAKIPQGTSPAQPAGPADKAVPPQKAAEAKKQEAQPKYNIENFSYNPMGTRNPFEPILLLKAKTSRGLSVKTVKRTPDKAKSEKIDYELEELRLVGVIKSGTGMIAMMEDIQGKGIFFRKGDYLNKSMWVEDVSASNMVLGYKARGETKKISVNIPTKN
ncbi:MAG: pilus assembly protein PilP [Syntrophorhabdaceae bacterium]